jgi:hypothetical protein
MAELASSPGATNCSYSMVRPSTSTPPTSTPSPTPTAAR